MPDPKQGESRKDFVSRCIPFVLREPKHKGMKPDQAAAMCHSMYTDKRKGESIDMEDFASSELYFQHLDAQAGREPTTVQTLVMSKQRFPTRAAASAWAREKGFKSNTIRETTNSWRLRQRPPEDFKQESFKVIQMTNGVQSVIGHLN